MGTRIILFISLFCLSFTISFAQKLEDRIADRFVLKGKIIGKQSGMIYLVSRNINNERIVDSAYLKKGNFSFFGSVQGYSDNFYLKLNRNELRNLDSLNSVQIAIEPSRMFVRLRLNEFSNYKIKGCKSCREASQFEKSLADTDKLDDTIRNNEFANKVDSSVIRRFNYWQHQNFLANINLIRNKPNSNLSPYLLFRIASNFGENNYEYFIALYNLLSQENQQSFYGRRTEIKIIEFRDRISAVGKPVPSLKGKLLNEDSFDLQKFVQGKLTLLDFWASWCVPCRRGNPELIDLYNLYHSKNFNIVAISDDQDRDKWLKAIDADGIGRFNHLLYKDAETQNWNTANGTSNLFFDSLPTRILVDDKGNIIGRYFSEDLKQLTESIERFFEKSNLR